LHEGKFSDELYEHLLSKDMNSFWKTWSSKACKKVLSVASIDGEADDHKIADIFCKKFSEPLVCASHVEPLCVDYLKDTAPVQQ